MKEKIKILFLQTLMIAFGTVTFMCISGIIAHMRGDSFVLMWYHPLSIVVTSVLCSLPFIFLFDLENMSKRKALFRLVLHCLILYLMVMGLGYVFVWYTSWSGFVILTVGYFLVYTFVWVAMLWLYKQEAKQINTILDIIRDDE